MDPNIKHLVISGGGTFGLTAYGILKETHNKGFWNINNIESCHGTSVGTIVSLLILLKYDWEEIDNYLIKRPWNQLFKYDIKNCLNTYEKCGAFQKNDFVKSFEPLFSGVEIDININMKDFYELTKIEFYSYAVEMNYFNLECFSHKTHPEMKVVDAVYASCCLPIVFQPLIIEDKAYIDGGLFLNYPLRQCIEKMNANVDEVFGIYKSMNGENKKLVDEKSNMFDYFLVVFKNMVKLMNKDSYTSECKYQIQIHRGHTTFDELQKFIESESYRESMIKEASSYCDDFMKKIESINENA